MSNSPEVQLKSIKCEFLKKKQFIHFLKGNEPNIDKALELEWKSTDSRRNETIKLKCVTEEDEAAQIAIEEVIEQTQYTNLNLVYTNFT